MQDLKSGSKSISRYQNSNLSEDLGKVLFQRLENWMTSEKPYLDSDLTLAKMAFYLETNTTYLSQVINHYKGIPARDFINSYRMKELDVLVEEQEIRSYTLHAISQMCGFKSYSSFKRAVIKSKGCTPKAFWG